MWNNGSAVVQKDKPNRYRPNSERADTTLTSGSNRLLVQVVGSGGESRFHLRFRRKSSQAEHERLTRMALKDHGNVQRGREVLLNSEKSLCLKCHRLGQWGTQIGPDLTVIGSRFSRVHLIESILDPSRTIAPSYETIVVALADGRVLTGVKSEETPATLSLGDSEGKTHLVPKRDIDIIQVQDRSTMPDGLEKRLTDRELLDLIAFLLAQKKTTAE